MCFSDLGSVGITREQFDKLRGQKQQYLEAKQKLEAQLLKLKEQREALKEDGAVHEDVIMKENAKLQVIFSHSNLLLILCQFRPLCVPKII